jgi:S1-C subfamily serine protease
VVTADHVLERDEGIVVVLPDQHKVAATIAGRDPGTDIAVLRLEPLGAAPKERIPAGEEAGPSPAVGPADLEGEAQGAAELAPAESVKVGHLVMAIGRPRAGTAMASFGMVSALGGPWRTARGGRVEAYIRADVVLYPGFSGGPLVDVEGRVLGLNSWHLARGQEVAIPSATVNGVVQTLLTQGRVRRGYLGVTSQAVRLPESLRERLDLQQEAGLMVVGVEPDSPADKGGLLIGDILLAMGDQPMADAEDLRGALGPEVVGKPVVVSVLRGGARTEVRVTPAERT